MVREGLLPPPRRRTKMLNEINQRIPCKNAIVGFEVETDARPKEEDEVLRSLESGVQSLITRLSLLQRDVIEKYKDDPQRYITIVEQVDDHLTMVARDAIKTQQEAKIAWDRHHNQ